MGSSSFIVGDEMGKDTVVEVDPCDHVQSLVNDFSNCVSRIRDSGEKPDEKWGETPCAFIELKDASAGTTEREIIDFCRDNLAHYKCPRHVFFGPLPKTSTGKIQKFVLRQRANS